MTKSPVYVQLMVLAGIFLAISQSCSDPKAHQLVFPDYPSMKIGFSTQSFMKAFPFNVESLNELINYAHKEGYQFIELRDNEAQLTSDECKALAEQANQAGIEVIYEINLNLLHPDFPAAFERAILNAQVFLPGMLRTCITHSEFADDPSKVGWTIEEITTASIMAENCAIMADEKGVKFLVENVTEPFIGNPPYYYGLSDLFQHTESVGLQFDLSNPFVSISRKKTEPEEVSAYLNLLGDRWTTTHIKTSINGVVQPVLGDNPLSIPEITTLMGNVGAEYFAIEVTPVDNKEDCFRNHTRSIKFLKELGIINEK